ncbi:MAG: toll/interleukin-1 receptor domain-containing protein [Xanthobacteraceae bacterium]
MMPFDVFISYSQIDKVTADAACATLEAGGIRCWIAPRDIVPGVPWAGAII